MSGAPTATTVFLSLDAAINYSDGTSDTLPANTLALLPDGTSTAFDRTADVYVPYVIKGDATLRIIKESLLPTLTSDYAPLARVELHGIKPYQPEPYLAAGGSGTAPRTTTDILSTAGLSRAHALGTWSGSGGQPSAPAGWETLGFDDSGWSATVAETSADTPLHIGPAAPGAQWVTYQDGNVAYEELWLLRQRFSLPPGLVVTAQLLWNADDTLSEVWINGTQVTPTPTSAAHPCSPNSTALPLAPFAPGASNVLAVKVWNSQAGNGLPGPTAWTMDLSVTQQGSGGLADPGGHEGDLLYYHGGAWVDLPIGSSGQELTVVSGDPAWATPAGGTLTSVALAGPTGTTVSGSPVTSSGTLSLAWASQSANTVLAAPTGSSGAPTFRALVGTDIPVDASTIISSAGTIKGNYQAGSGITISGNTISASGGGGSGTVTSVALSLPGIFSVSGSPVTTSGTLSATLANENAATVLAGPATGSAAAPTFRALAGSDLPPAAGAGGHIHAHGHFL